MPDDVGIDIELSKCSLDDVPPKVYTNVLFEEYPMLWEAEDWEMDTYSVEFNIVVDTVLDEVYTYVKDRPIVFTSFSPELCIILSHKQQKYPVILLNESNLFPTGDVRASNLQEAVQFARY